MTLERKPVGITAPYRQTTPEDEEFNRVEMESRIKQEHIRAMQNKRTWQGLNWGDIPESQKDNFDFMEGARWAEKYLKEKNNA